MLLAKLLEKVNDGQELKCCWKHFFKQGIVGLGREGGGGVQGLKDEG